jgi:hypothetical protein
MSYDWNGARLKRTRLMRLAAVISAESGRATKARPFLFQPVNICKFAYE